MCTVTLVSDHFLQNNTIFTPESAPMVSFMIDDLEMAMLLFDEHANAMSGPTWSSERVRQTKSLSSLNSPNLSLPPQDSNICSCMLNCLNIIMDDCGIYGRNGLLSFIPENLPELVSPDDLATIEEELDVGDLATFELFDSLIYFPVRKYTATLD